MKYIIYFLVLLMAISVVQAVGETVTIQSSNYASNIQTVVFKVSSTASIKAWTIDIPLPSGWTYSNKVFSGATTGNGVSFCRVESNILSCGSTSDTSSDLDTSVSVTFAGSAVATAAGTFSIGSGTGNIAGNLQTINFGSSNVNPTSSTTTTTLPSSPNTCSFYQTKSGTTCKTATWALWVLGFLVVIIGFKYMRK